MIRIKATGLFSEFKYGMLWKIIAKFYIYKNIEYELESLFDNGVFDSELFKTISAWVHEILIMILCCIWWCVLFLNFHFIFKYYQKIAKRIFENIVCESRRRPVSFRFYLLKYFSLHLTFKHSDSFAFFSSLIDSLLKSSRKIETGISSW